MTWRVEPWALVPGFEHGFGGRHDAAPVGVTVVRQVHGRTVHAASEIPPSGAEGDGVIVSAGEGAAIGTADCVPVLFLAGDTRVAAALHAGWRGAAVGIVDTALERFEREWGVSSGRIEAALGPSIGGCCYEVGEDVRQAFRLACGEAGTSGFERRDEGNGPRWFLDLRVFLEARLRTLGVARVTRVGPCTACTPDRLCSYRREGPAAGRQQSWVRWR